MYILVQRKSTKRKPPEGGSLFCGDGGFESRVTKIFVRAMHSKNQSTLDPTSALSPAYAGAPAVLHRHVLIKRKHPKRVLSFYCGDGGDEATSNM